MRIVAGSLKGRTLRGPSGPGVRPTSDRLRETLFNVLADRVEGARVLDGYAGTGAIGLEALSRGAASVTFVERDRAALDVLRANVAALRMTDRSTVVAGDVVGAMTGTLARSRFELVILDPPYDVTALDDLVAAAATVVEPAGLVILEHASRRDSPVRVPGLARGRQLVAGDSALSVYVPWAP